MLVFSGMLVYLDIRSGLGHRRKYVSKVVSATVQCCMFCMA